MKKNQHKRIFLFAVVCLATALQAFAQVGYVSEYGLKDNLDEYYTTHDGQTGTFIIYDRPNPYTGASNRRVHGVDDLVIGQLDGKHWTGDVLNSGEDKNGVYLVNAKTGEYLTWADDWGTTQTTDYVGLKLDLKSGFTCRADLEGPYQAEGTTPDGVTKAMRVGKGYKILNAYNPLQCIGRAQTSSGAVGVFEQRPFMVNRSANSYEYINHIDDTGDPGPGHFVFYFYPVQKNGKQYYVIYTHRQTTTGIHNAFYANGRGKTGTDITDLITYNKWKRLVEFDNRDSYLCLRSQKSDIADYNVIAYKKFAGQMFYDLDLDTKYYFKEYTRANQTPHPAGTDANLNNWGGERTYFSQDELDYMATVPIDPETGTKLDPNYRFVSLKDGLKALTEGDDIDEACLWKIVTHEERKKYRVTANIDKPIDVSFNIENPNFSPSRLPYEVQTGTGTPSPGYGWEWHNKETGSDMHNHPYDDATYSYGGEFHKIGTHFNDRWGFGKPGDEVALGINRAIKDNGTWGDVVVKEKTRRDERAMTQGQESDFVGSIYEGSAALRQTITGLRPGRYIAYCRAFYAPHNMMNFDNKQAFYTKTDNFETYYDEEKEEYYDVYVGYDVAYNKPPTWNGSTTIPSDVTDAIANQPLSDQSFFFAISKPDGETPVERKRDIPSIYCGMMPLTAERLEGVSKEEYINDQGLFAYTALGDRLYSQEYGSGEIDPTTGMPIPDWEKNNPGTGVANKHSYYLLQDSTVFALIPNGAKGTYFVPRNLTGAARFFNAVDKTKHPEAQMYRIGLPVEVGSDGELTIGIDHKELTTNEDWVCFDKFELIYYGDKNSWDFVIDETSPQNCTRYHDLFDWEESYLPELTRPATANTRNARVAIKRSLDPSKYVPLVLPLSLTKKQVRDAFGEDVKISTPSRISSKIIYFDPIDAKEGTDSEIAIEAYKPYIVKPSMAAPVGSAEKWGRTRFVRADDNAFGWPSGQVSYYHLSEEGGDSLFVPKPGRNHQINEEADGLKRDIQGPLYFVDGYTISKTVHYQYPLPTEADNHFTGNNPENGIFDYTKAWYNASYQWNPVGDVYVGAERMKIKGGKDGKTYQLRATCYYDALGSTVGSVPPYSYYMSGGQLKWNGSTGSKQSKGFSFYLQIVESEPIETVKIVNLFNTSTGPHLTSWSSWGNDLMSNTNSGVAGLTINTKNASGTDYAAINKGNYPSGNPASQQYRHLVISRQHTGAENNTETTTTITLTAPAGYKIDGYKIGGYCNNAANETYTLTAAGGASINIDQQSAYAEPECLEVSRLDVPSTTLTLTTHTTTWNSSSNYALFPVFVVNLRKIPEGGSAKVFAGNVGDFEWVPAIDEDEVTGVTETFREFENPANDLYYDLQGRPVKTPRKNGIYIFHGKKIVY